MEYFVRINNINGSILERKIIEADNKEMVKEKLLADYPTLFPNDKVYQKRSKKDTEQVVFCNIFELDNYWNNHWNSEIECFHCKCKTKHINLYENGSIYFTAHGNNFCSEKCRNEYYEELEKYREENKVNDEEVFNVKSASYIYKITEKISNKCYIGITQRFFLWRWWEHIQHSSAPFGLYIKEVGADQFKYEVIDTFEPNTISRKELEEKETKYIEKYDSINNGFNSMVSNKNVIDKEIAKGQTSLFEKE